MVVNKKSELATSATGDPRYEFASVDVDARGVDIAHRPSTKFIYSVAKMNTSSSSTLRIDTNM